MKKVTKKTTKTKDVTTDDVIVPPDAELVVTVEGAPTAVFPVLNTKYIFSNDQNEFVAEIKSFDPLVVWQWSIVGGCQSSTELSIESLDEYTITDDKDEVFRRLA